MHCISTTGTPLKEPKGFSDDTLAYKSLRDCDPEIGGEEPVHLLKCCGIDRPRGKAVQLAAHPDAASGRNFVTINDYLSAVYPWLMSLREDIMGSSALIDNVEIPLPAETKLMVGWCEPSVVTVTQEGEWIRDKTRGW